MNELQDDPSWTSYRDARASFLEAAGGARVLSIRHPLRGPAGEELALDAAILGDERAPALLVVVSGTHGVEGLGGSRAQTRLLDGWRSCLPGGDVCVLLVHALNPFGFAWSRRANEDGVDLARNFVDFTRPLPENPAFLEIADALVPRDFYGEGKRVADEAIRDWVQRRGPREARAMARGQYTHPRAPFYGGAAPAWSNSTFRTLMRRFADSCRRIIVVDIHTGLGTWGVGHLIGMHEATSEAARWGHVVWPGTFAPMGTGEVGYSVTGSLSAAVAEELPHALSLVATYEFGVGDEREAVEVLRADHWLHAYGKAADISNLETLAIRTRMRRAFFDASSAWGDAVYAQTASCVDGALQGLRDRAMIRSEGATVLHR